MGNNAIIVGASSGIGKALAHELCNEGYRLGLAGRRILLLKELKNSLDTDVFIQEMDVSIPGTAETQFLNLIEKLGSVDLVIISAGIGYENAGLDASLELETIDTNVKGFVVIADASYNYFLSLGKGHLVGISSIAALRGNADAPAYNASKAFVSNYLEGLRLKSLKNSLHIIVTDIMPGFVDTKMAKGEGLFWVSSPEKAAGQIYQSIKDKKSHSYVTRRWRLIAWLMKLIPDQLLKKI